MERINQTRKTWVYSYLGLVIGLIMSQAHALQAMDDGALRAIDGQDGVNINFEYDKIKIDQLALRDQVSTEATRPQGLSAQLNQITIDRGQLADGKKLGAQLGFDVYSGATAQPGLNLIVQSTLGKVRAEQFMLCASQDCTITQSLGAFEFESYNPTQFNMLTSKGLFNQDSKAVLGLSIKDASLALLQKDQNGVAHKFALQNFTFNWNSTGYMYVDSQAGLTLKTGTDGFADFQRDDTTGRSGVNLEFGVNGQGLIRGGMSGRLVNGFVQFGAGKNPSELLATTANNNTGANGVKLRIEGQFTNDLDQLGDKATTLELGSAGQYAYGLRFENITALRTRSNVVGNEQGDLALSHERSGISMDGIYLNLVNSSMIKLPENMVLNNIYLGTNSGAKASKLVQGTDYQQLLAQTAVNPYSAVLALRQVDLMAMSRRGRFIATPDITVKDQLPSTEPTKWGLGIPIHNLNANIAVYGKTSDGVNDFIATKDANNIPILKAVKGSERLGFSAAVSTQGVSSDGSKTTSLLLIDGSDNNNYANGTVTPTDYYLGIRNIDMLFNGYGSIGLENGQVNVSMPDLRLVVAAQLAAGYLPGAKYRSCPSMGGVMHHPTVLFVIMMCLLVLKYVLLVQ
ncbi:hypothetical protein RFH42_15005 [Acinetobacter rudis]|uniref:DUF6160 family protein n=1 Tax=Acinetobacter rudis TaxID=632955 RepID=UPI002810212B|nr:DUF6160 family protein [Acinetobacter rudis]MDQ8954258.1 hypothetical protein [Acinetobacter rudis]